MKIKVTFTIKTRLSDADIKNSILDNENWSFVKEGDVNVWSPVSILPTDILPAQEIKNFPHVTFIDICHDPDFQDFDELAAFIENKFDESEERFYDRGWFNDPDIPLSVGDFDDKAYNILDSVYSNLQQIFNPPAGKEKSELKEPDMHRKYVARLKRMKKSELKEPDMYYFTIEHVKKGITWKKIEELVSEKLEEEYAVFSSIFEDAPSFESVDVFQHHNDGAIVYITAHCRFFEWLGFENLKAFIKEKIEKPEETIKHSYTFNETTSTGGFEVVFKTNDRNEFENVKEVVSNMVDYKED